MADRVKSGNANLKGLMGNSNMMEHAFMYPNKLKKAPNTSGNVNMSINTAANQKSHVVGSGASSK